MINRILRLIGRILARYLTKPRPRMTSVTTSDPQLLAETLRPSDVLLVDGDTQISVAIKYLTQSTWSHAALYVGDALGAPPPGSEPRVLIDADLNDGVRAVPLSAFAGMHTRICRPVGLTPDDLKTVIHYAISRMGHTYDLRNLIDLARWLFPTPPVPTPWRRRMIALGSGDPTRAICSTLIAQAFQSVRYPILPHVTVEQLEDPACRGCDREILHIRHYSLFAPRDFDISPYFEIVKPLPTDFDYKAITWGDRQTPDSVAAHS